MCRAVSSTTAFAAAISSLAWRPWRNSRENFGASFCSDVCEKKVIGILQHFRQCQVIAGRRFRPRPHGIAETCAAGLRAIDGYDEDVLATRFVGRVGVGTFEKNLVLDLNGVQFTGANAKKCELTGLRLLPKYLEVAVCTLRFPEPSNGRKQELFPGMRPDRVSE